MKTVVSFGRLGACALSAGEPCQLEINLPQPSARGSFFNVVNTPLQLVLRGLSLMETVGKLRADRAGDPIHNEDLATGKFFGPVQHGNRLLHPTDSAQQRDGVCMLRS